MEAFSIEQSVLEGEKEVKELFEYVRQQAKELEAYEMEQAIFSRVMRIGLCAMKGYFAEKGTGDVGEELEVEQGVVLKQEGILRGRDYYSVFGKVKVPRSCYRAEGQEGVMPLDGQANLPERCYSYLLQEWMDWMSFRDSFGEGEESLEKLLGVKVKASRLEVVSRESSQDYEEFYQGRQVPCEDSEGEVQVMSFDGKGVPMIKREAAKLQARLGKGEKRQKKKEAMVGVSYTINRKERSAEQVAQNLIYPEHSTEKNKQCEAEPVKGQNIRRLASVERSRQEVMEVMIEDAKARDPLHQRPWVVLMDGALHLWSVLAVVLQGVSFVGIVDIIHVVEYLWEVANALYGENSTQGKNWVYKHLVSILKGRVGWVIGGLKQSLTKQKLKASQRKVLDKAISYFENHRHWMKYDEYLKAGYPIGTGVVESSCGHVVKNRMEGSGRRWSVEGAESTLLLRSIYMSGDWEAYWKTHRHLQRRRLYGKTLDALEGLIPDGSSKLSQCGFQSHTEQTHTKAA
ncbi:MAG: ISKra4 family transposase [Nitrospira sp.]|nr:ISKra4 family transposase [Nitrospira sp.]